MERKERRNKKGHGERRAMSRQQETTTDNYETTSGANSVSSNSASKTNANSVTIKKERGKHYTHAEYCGRTRKELKVFNILQFLVAQYLQMDKEKIKRNDLMKGIKRMIKTERRQTCYQWIKTLKNMGVIEVSRNEQLKAPSTQRREDYVYRSYTCRTREEAFDWQLNVNSKLKKRKVGEDSLPTKKIETDSTNYSTYYWIDRERVAEIRQMIGEKENSFQELHANKQET